MNVQLDSFRNTLATYKSSVQDFNTNSSNLASQSSLLKEDLYLENNVDLINQNLLVNVCNEINELNK